MYNRRKNSHDDDDDDDEEKVKNRDAHERNDNNDDVSPGAHKVSNVYYYFNIHIIYCIIFYILIDIR
jgi:hypothetical protein